MTLKGLAEEFKRFVLRGNVVELAVAVAIGAAFTAVVTSFTENILSPLLTIPGDAGDFSELTFSIGTSTFSYGLFLNAIVAFLLTAAVVFFAIVRPLNRLASRRKPDTPAAVTTRDCPECLSAIPLAARRCAFCTATVAPGDQVS